MHVKSYVLVPVTEATSSLEARKYVTEVLGDDPTFVGKEGRFATPVCDWFVIGGRWSGTLCPKELIDEFYGQVRKVFDKENPYMLDSSFIKKNCKTLESIWKRLGQKHNSLLTRNSACRLGEEDDACMLDYRLAEELNRFLYDTDNHSIDGCYVTGCVWWKPVKLISLDEDREMLCELDNFYQVVGEYWVVLIDYHH